MRGQQSLTVDIGRDSVVVASDAAHYYESFEMELVFTTHEDVFKMLEGYRKLRRLAPDDSHIIPGHDPLVLARYPAPRPELEGIVARVDVVPVG